MFDFVLNDLVSDESKNFLIQIFQYAKSIHASDIYLKPEFPPFFSSIVAKGIAGAKGFTNHFDHSKELSIYTFKDGELYKTKQSLNEIANKINKGLPPKVVNDLLSKLGIKLERLKAEKKGIHFSVNFKVKTKNYENLGLFRFVVSLERGNPILTARRLFHSIPSAEQLGLPVGLLSKIFRLQSGLVIIAGPTGSGKSTTLASILELYNNSKYSDAKIIVSIEKPIEYIHKSYYSFYIQKEVGSDIDSFVEGVDTALREHPDVIVLGEVRTNEEIEQALRASETGHLVFITLHTSSAVEAIRRITTVFSGNDERRIRAMLSSQLQIVLVQRLVKSKRGVPVLVYEYMDFTNPKKSQPWREQIYRGEEEKLRDVLIREPEHVSLQKRLAELVNENVIDKREAVAIAYDTSELQKYINIE